MSADYYPALWYPGRNFTPGRAGERPRFVFLHGTGWPVSARYWIDHASDAGVTYMVLKDGTVLQFVRESDTHWGNGRLDMGHDPIFGPGGTYPDANRVSFSVEHEKYSKTNDEDLTPRQRGAAFALVAHLCRTYGIPPRWYDVRGGIAPHFVVAPLTRWYCPGTYPWDALFSYLAAAV